MSGKVPKIILKIIIFVLWVFSSLKVLAYALTNLLLVKHARKQQCI